MSDSVIRVVVRFSHGPEGAIAVSVSSGRSVCATENVPLPQPASSGDEDDEEPKLPLPGEAGAALARLADGCSASEQLEVRIEAADSELAGLRLDSLCLPDGRRLAKHAAVAVCYRMTTDSPLAQHADTYWRAEEAERTNPDFPEQQRELAVACNRMGDLCADSGQPEAARAFYARDLAISERLAQSDPSRIDYQRDLSVSCERMGDALRALNQIDPARIAYLRSLEIRERVAATEPDRAEFERDLSVAYNKLGDLYRAAEQNGKAKEYYAKDLAITEKLVEGDPERDEYQRDLVVSLVRMGKVDDAHAAAHFRRALDILEALRTKGRLPASDEMMISVLHRLLREDGPLNPKNRQLPAGPIRWMASLRNWLQKT